MMSKSKIEGNINHLTLQNSESKKVPNHLITTNSLFSEILKNHSGQNTPVSNESIPFDVKDVPLPEEFPIKHNLKKITKTDRTRKRSNDGREEIMSKRKKHENQRPKVEIKKEHIRYKMPKLCESRTHIRQNSTWGERSVKSFKILTEVGEGTYGHVFKAIDRRTNTIKALKKVRLENEREGFPITTVREIKILQQLNHANIVKLHEVVTDYDLNDSINKDKNARDKGFYLVFEYMDHDLYGILDSGISLGELQIASIIKQILEGINYSHKKMFLHRDIKCSNILINNRGEVKIADYGLSRRFYSDNTALRRPYTNKVITLWYRAPELLLGEEYYSTPIDLWSIGCIMGELFTHRTMFVANTEMDQLDVISRVCGTPSPATWPDVTKLPLYQTYRPKYSNKRRLREYYFTIPNNALEILDWMLQLDPKRRCTADQALRSYWLNKVDPKKIEPLQFPTDGDYHELSCKRRHKENRSDTSYSKYSKSSLKGRHSSSSSVQSEQPLHQSDTASVASHSQPPLEAPTTVDTAPPSTDTAFQLPDDMLGLLNTQLAHLMPDTDAISQMLQSMDPSHTDNVKDTLERLLEPYIKQLLSQHIAKSMDSRGSDVMGSGQSTLSADSSVHRPPSTTISPHNLSDK